MLRGGAGEEAADFGAIAEVERRFSGLGVLGLTPDREEAEAFDIGGERGLSGLGTLLPLLCDDGGLGVFEVDGEESF